MAVLVDLSHVLASERHGRVAPAVFALLSLPMGHAKPETEEYGRAVRSSTNLSARVHDLQAGEKGNADGVCRSGIFIIKKVPPPCSETSLEPSSIPPCV